VRHLLAKGPYTSAYHVGGGDKPNFVTAFEKKRPAALMNLVRLEHGRRSGDTFLYLRIDFALIGQRIKRNVKSRPSPARDVSYFR